MAERKKKTSRFRKYRDGYWLKSRYILYRYWFKFLRYAELDPFRIVDWSKYQGWGGREAVVNERFEDWWEKRWRKLFGVRDESATAEYQIANRKMRAEAVRIALLVYEHRDVGDGRNIFDALNRKYRKLGSLDRYETDDDGQVKTKNGKPVERVLETKYLNQHIKRYREYAEGLLDDVCVGQFGQAAFSAP